VNTEKTISIAPCPTLVGSIAFSNEQHNCPWCGKQMQKSDIERVNPENE